MARFVGYISTWWAALVRPESAAALVLDRERGARFSRFLALAVAALYAVYGLSMGVYRGAAATVFSALKLPLLYLAANALVLVVMLVRVFSDEPGALYPLFGLLILIATYLSHRFRLVGNSR